MSANRRNAMSWETQFSRKRNRPVSTATTIRRAASRSIESPSRTLATISAPITPTAIAPKKCAMPVRNESEVLNQYGAARVSSRDDVSRQPIPSARMIASVAPPS